jgi:site-specific recombinase XerD
VSTQDRPEKAPPPPVRYLRGGGSANIRNRHARRAYYRAPEEFLSWCGALGVPTIAAVQPVHVATWVEASTRELAAPSVKQRLAALWHLFDWLVTGQVVPINPAASVRGLRHVVTSGQTPVLDPAEARALLDSIDTSMVVGLRDRALIGLVVYSFARIGAALGMTVEDVFRQNPWLWVRLREKGGKRHAMPCHHNLEEYLTTYLDSAGVRGDPKGLLFRTIDRGTGKLTRTVLPQANAYAMIRRRAAAAGIATRLGNHSFRATGITANLKNGGTLEEAAAMANHASTRTTQLYDRRAEPRRGRVDCDLPLRPYRLPLLHQTYATKSALNINSLTLLEQARRGSRGQKVVNRSYEKSQRVVQSAFREAGLVFALFSKCELRHTSRPIR